jgi:hypothetical protein
MKTLICFSPLCQPAYWRNILKSLPRLTIEYPVRKRFLSIPFSRRREWNFDHRLTR